jgi:hypothetical protein
LKKLLPPLSEENVSIPRAMNGPYQRVSRSEAPIG